MPVISSTGFSRQASKGERSSPGQGTRRYSFSFRGDLTLRGHVTGALKQGQALHLRDDETCLLDNPGDREAVYVVAGGHAEGGHHG